MKVLTYKFKHKELYLYPIGDIHVGDKAFTKESEEKLKGYINWVKDTPNAYIFLNGDLVNCASRTSASSPFEQDMTLREQIDYVVKLLLPVSDKILGAVTGNHEFRMENTFGYNPTISICDRLQIPYCGFSSIVKIGLGKRSKGKGRVNESNVSYSLYFHHTTGGGGTVGGKVNRIDKLRQLVANCDVYLGSHNHMLAVIPTVTHLFDDRNNTVYKKRQVLVDCGGYLDWQGYPEQNMLPPMKLGSPRIRLDGKRKDVHVEV